jgi:hypothetical protein
MKRILPAALALAAAAPGPAAANELYDAYFAKRAAACYARGYNAAHLQRNPQQKVQRIELAFRRVAKSAASAFEVRLGLVAKGQTTRFSSPAYCAAEGAAVVCKVEGDGGTFRLGAGPGGALTLEVVGDGLRMEGARGFLEVGGARSDDNRFLLAPVNWQACRVAGRQ